MIRADGPENALVAFIDERALAYDFVKSLVDDVNARMAQRASSLRGRLDEKRHRLEEVERSINILLDLAEQFGAASAAARLLERETECD